MWTNRRDCIGEGCSQFTFQWELKTLTFKSNLLSTPGIEAGFLPPSFCSIGLETAPSLHASLATWIEGRSFSIAKMSQALPMFIAHHIPSIQFPLSPPIFFNIISPTSFPRHPLFLIAFNCSCCSVFCLGFFFSYSLRKTCQVSFAMPLPHWQLSDPQPQARLLPDLSLFFGVLGLSLADAL